MTDIRLSIRKIDLYFIFHIPGGRRCPADAML